MRQAIADWERREMEMINAVRWRKSSRCANSACVEVAKVAGKYLIRDSKYPDRAPLTFSAAEWAAFVEGVAAGDFRF
jgi:hypothetical protein